MKTYILLGLTLFFSASVGAFQTGDLLTPLKFESQFSENMQVSESTQWILFAADKASGKLVTDHLLESKYNIDESGMVYVSDISKMPSLITRMIALPKMKKYPFKMALDKEGVVTATWPRQEGKVTLIELDHLKVKNIRFVATQGELGEILKSKK